MMTQNPQDIEDQIQQAYKMAAPVSAYAAAQMAATPVNPHASLTVPIGPPRMSARTNELGDALPDAVPSASPETDSTPKMSAMKQHVTNNLMADYKKDADPYGSADNHPGFFGKLLHGLNVATGGVNRRGFEEQGLEKRLQDIDKLESEENLQGAQAANQTATAGHTNAETPEVAPNAESARGVQGAETRHLNDESNNLENPQPEYEVHDTAEGPMVVNKKTGIGQHLSVNGLPVGPKVQTKVVPLQIGGEDHQVLVNDADGTVIKDLGKGGIKPPVVRVETAGEQRGAKNDILKAYQSTLDSAERMNVMTDAYEKAIKDHDQQAMLNLLANHLGMTMGLQKGARITRDLYQEAAQSTPWLQKVGAKFDKDGYLSGVTLNPQQMRQMVNLAQERYAEDVKKSRATGQYLGASDDGPARVPGKSTINYYLGLAGGDLNKAKQLAADDGWSVK